MTRKTDIRPRFDWKDSVPRRVVTVAAVAALLWTAPMAAAQIALPGPGESPALEAPLTNAEIVKLTKAGLSPDLIVMKIKQAPAENLDVSTDALIALRHQEVGDIVIAAIFERVAKRAAQTAPAKASPNSTPPPANETPEAPARRDPSPFPDLELVRADGASVRLSQLEGNIVLVIVWATWNPPSGKELPIIQKLYDLYRNRNFRVVSLNVDSDRTRVAPFLRKLDVSLPVYFASPADTGSLTASGIPSTIILGADRTVLDRTVGFYPDWESRWKQVVEKHARP